MFNRGNEMKTFKVVSVCLVMFFVAISISHAGPWKAMKRQILIDYYLGQRAVVCQPAPVVYNPPIVCNQSIVVNQPIVSNNNISDGVHRYGNNDRRNSRSSNQCNSNNGRRDTRVSCNDNRQCDNRTYRR